MGHSDAISMHPYVMTMGLTGPTEAVHMLPVVLFRMGILSPRNFREISTFNFQLENSRFSGWGKMNIALNSAMKANADFCMECVVEGSAEADYHETRNPMDPQYYCITLSGYIAGWLSNMYHMEMATVEVGCRGSGPRRFADPKKIFRIFLYFEILESPNLENLFYSRKN